LVFICTTCGARLSGLDFQERHCSETGHSNFEVHSEDGDASAMEGVVKEVGAKEGSGLSEKLTAKVTLQKKAWLRLAEIQSYYGLNDMNKALLKAINFTHESIAGKKEKPD
jgi:hypothetical protein